MSVELSDDAPVLSPSDQGKLAAFLLRNLPTLEQNQVDAAEFNLVVTPQSDQSAVPTAADRRAAHGVLSEEHVATLGAELFSRHLIAIEVAGTLLLVALVGAIAIVSHDRLPPHAGSAVSVTGVTGRS